MVTINIQKKDLFLLVAIVVLLVGAGVIVASNEDWRTDINANSKASVRESNALIHGHTPDEVLITIPTRIHFFLSSIFI